MTWYVAPDGHPSVGDPADPGYGRDKDKPARWSDLQRLLAEGDTVIAQPGEYPPLVDSPDRVTVLTGLAARAHESETGHVVAVLETLAADGTIYRCVDCNWPEGV
jgi:hypothetical protein